MEFNTTVDPPINMTMADELPDTDPETVSYKDFVTYDIGRAITRYWFPIMGPVGLIGNVISLIIMLMPSNRRLIVSIYLAIIAVNDSITIAFVNSYIWSHDYFLHAWNNLECKTFMYFASVFTQAASLLLLLMTYDKFNVIRNPLKSSYDNSMKRLKIGVGVIYFLVITINILKFPSSWAVGFTCYSSGSDTWYLMAFLIYRIVVGKSVGFHFSFKRKT